MKAGESKPKFFRNQSAFRKWLTTHHNRKEELWVGYYKKATGITSITWPQSVDEALCFGWIDGIRKSIGKESYKIRFTPRRAKSIWSAVNLKRIKKLIEMKRVHSSGRKVFEKRDTRKSERYSYEQLGTSRIPCKYESELRANKKAWSYFQALPPSARKASIWWLISAKREETQLRRLRILIESSEKELRIPPLRRGKAGS